MKKVYVETSILSFLCAEPSSIKKTAELQRATLDWWMNHRHKYEVYVSSEVMIEIGKGDPEHARLRLEKAAELKRIMSLADDQALAKELTDRGLLPRKATIDASHLAIAVRTNMDYLLTWNLKHLANPIALPLVYDYLRRTFRHVPLITTPVKLMELIR